jgi:hypothetical protein
VASITRPKQGGGAKMQGITEIVKNGEFCTECEHYNEEDCHLVCYGVWLRLIAQGEMRKDR